MVLVFGEDLTGGAERTRTADFHVANVFEADFGGLR
jgi:hypothetical protein